MSDSIPDSIPAGDAPSGAWDVWLHPRRTLSRIELLADENASIPELREALREVEESLAAQRSHNERLTVQKAELASRLAAAHSEAEALRQELSVANARILDLEEVEKDLEEFTKVLDNVEAMKRNYENRIRTLRAQLLDTRQALKAVTGVDHSDDLAVIHMELHQPAPRGIPPRPLSAMTTDPDFVRPVNPAVGPDSITPPPPPPPEPEPEPEPPKLRRGQHRRHPSPYLPPLPPHPSDDSDWLVTLPDN